MALPDNAAMHPQLFHRTLCLAFLALALFAGVPHLHASADANHAADQCPLCQAQSQCGHYLPLDAVAVAAEAMLEVAPASELLLPCAASCPQSLFSRPPPSA